MDRIYYEYSEYLKNKYGCKVYKLPVNIPVTCPNRDGLLGTGGCIFCGEVGAGFEMHESSMTIKSQLEKNKEYIGKKYKAEKFIAYFQNYSNTYLSVEKLKENIETALIEDIVGISISTRPDCISEEQLEMLSEIRDRENINIEIELGLQTCNYKTLKKINRGHTLAEFIDAVLMVRKYGFEVCAHIILNLPWDDMEDVIENAKILSALKIKFVKVHSLYILRNTILGEMYTNGEINMIEKDEYLERLEVFLLYLSPDIVIQRLFGRAPKEETLFSNWCTSWRKLKDELILKMKDNNSYQGKLCDYLGGKALNMKKN